MCTVYQCLTHSQQDEGSEEHRKNDEGAKETASREQDGVSHVTNDTPSIDSEEGGAKEDDKPPMLHADPPVGVATENGEGQ